MGKDILEGPLGGLSVPFRISKCSPVLLKKIIMFPGNFFVKYCIANAQYMMQNIQFLLRKRIIASFTNKHEISEQNELQIISYS